MKAYQIVVLEEYDMMNPEVSLHGVYKDEKKAIEKMAELIVERAKRDPDFEDALLHDQNHEDFPFKEGDKIDWNVVKNFIVEEYGSAYYVYSEREDMFNFDVVETEIFG